MWGSIESLLYALSLTSFLGLLVIVAGTGIAHTGKFIVVRTRGGSLKGDIIHLVGTAALGLIFLFVLYELTLNSSKLTLANAHLPPFLLPILLSFHVIVVPLARIRQRYPSSWLAYLTAFAVVLALPIVGSSVLSAAQLWSGDKSEQMTLVSDPGMRGSTCASLTKTLGFSDWSEEDLRDPEKATAIGMQFWYDNIFKAVALDLPDAFGCDLTEVRHNPNDIFASAAVAGYRTMIAFIAVILWYPVRRWWASKTTGSSATLLISRGGVRRTGVTVRIVRAKSHEEVFKASVIELGEQVPASLKPDEDHIFCVTYQRAFRSDIEESMPITKLGPKSIHAVEFGVTAFLRLGEEIYIKEPVHVASFASVEQPQRTAQPTAPNMSTA